VKDRDCFKHYIEECRKTKDWFRLLEESEAEVWDRIWSENLDERKGEVLVKIWKGKERAKKRKRERT